MQGVYNVHLQRAPNIIHDILIEHLNLENRHKNKRTSKIVKTSLKSWWYSTASLTNGSNEFPSRYACLIEHLSSKVDIAKTHAFFLHHPLENQDDLFGWCEEFINRRWLCFLNSCTGGCVWMCTPLTAWRWYKTRLVVSCLTELKCLAGLLPC